MTQIKPAPAPPDCLILDKDTSFMVGTSLRSWQARVPITEPLDIVALAGLPAKHYQLIREQT